MSRYEKFHFITSIIQNIIITISVIIGSIWALKTFIHQNPSFYETGWEIMGLEENKVSGKIELYLLDKHTSSYQVSLTLKNTSLNYSQVLNHSYFNIQSIHISDDNGNLISNDNKKQFVKYNSDLIKDYNLVIPSNESREYIGLIQFKKEGAYLLEINPCSEFKTNCLIQKYIFIRK